MPESTDPSLQPPPPSAGPEVVTGRAVVTAFQELEDDTWEIPPPPGFVQRWRRGWRLMLLLLLLAVGYGSWRGGRDYYRFKQWRARSLAGDAAMASTAAEALKLTAEDLKKLALVDVVVAEPLGGAHRSPALAMVAVGDAIWAALEPLLEQDGATLRIRRREKFLDMGRGAGL